MDNIRMKAERAVKEAGKLFLNPEMGEDLIEKKGVANFVTHIDYKVQNYLVKELLDILPGSNIITEESDENRLKLEGYTWVLDPVDGTTNLMYDYHHSAVSLGLFKDGKPVLGLVYNPTGDEMFAAEAGKGAELNGKPIKASSNGSLEDSLIAFGTTPYDRSRAEATFEAVKRIFVCSRDVRRTGSAALDIAYTACGRLDGFFEYTLQPWDYAAGLIILKEAGGKLTDCSGKEPQIVCPSAVVATNGLIHEELLKLL